MIVALHRARYALVIYTWLARETWLDVVARASASRWAHLDAGLCPRCGRPFSASTIRKGLGGSLAACGHCSGGLSRRDLRLIVAGTGRR